MCLRLFKLLDELWSNLIQTENCTVSQIAAFKRAYFGARRRDKKESCRDRFSIMRKKEAELDIAQDILRKLREHTGYSDQQVSKKLGISIDELNKSVYSFHC